jgi:pectin methylesterase-like acyl-CoA thioesterase
MAIALTLGMLGATPAASEILCVNPGGTGGCFASIQAAVDAAGFGDTIEIAAGTYNETVLVTGPTKLSIRGAGATATVIDAGGGDGISAEYQSRARLSVSDLTVKNAVYGISTNQRNRITVQRCIIQNSVTGVGAGIDSRLTVEDTTVDGAYVALRSGFARTRIVRSTFTNAMTYGIDTDGTTVIDSSTVSGNVVGVRSFGSRRTQIRSSTIANNSNPSACPAGLIGYNLVLTATIIADNTCPGTFADTNADITSRGYNLIEDGDSSQFGGRYDLDITGMDPALGPLQDNGGPTATHALLGGSPALDTVARASSCRPDQRGVLRPVPCDIGSFEAP